jgi:transcriptional regulator with XRE-family HTH domain
MASRANGGIRTNGTWVPPVVRKVVALMKERGLRVSEVERATEIGQNRLYHWTYKAGKPSPTQVRDLANYFGMTVDKLDDRTEPTDN